MENKDKNLLLEDDMSSIWKNIAYYRKKRDLTFVELSKKQEFIECIYLKLKWAKEIQPCK